MQNIDSNKLKNMKQILTLLLILTLSHFGKAQTIDTLIDVGGHKLHFTIIKGKGTPMLFEAGNGNDGSVWKPILQDIYNKTGATLITYDRAGLGESEIDTLKVSFRHEIKNLKKALKKLGFKADYFLIAHSFGGIYASEFSNTNKGKIKGAVFIDVATPCQLNSEVSNRIKSSISAENWALIKQYKIGLYYVLMNLPEINQYMEHRYIPNAIPLTVIVADNYVPTKEIGETEQDILNWKKCLWELGNLPNHKYVTTKNTDHRVWEKDPQTVIDEIVYLYKQVNKTKPNR